MSDDAFNLGVIRVSGKYNHVAGGGSFLYNFVDSFHKGAGRIRVRNAFFFKFLY